MAIRQRRGQAADLDVTQLQSGEIVVSLDTGDVTAKLEKDEYVVLARKDEVERQAEQIEKQGKQISQLSTENAELKSDLVDLEDGLGTSQLLAIDYQEGRMEIDGNISSPKYSHHKVVDCTAGEVYFVSGTGLSSNTAIWVFTDSSGNVVKYKPLADETVTDERVVTPSGATKLYVNSPIDRDCFVKKYIINVNNYEKINDYRNDLFNRFDEVFVNATCSGLVITHKATNGGAITNRLQKSKLNGKKVEINIKGSTTLSKLYVQVIVTTNTTDVYVNLKTIENANFDETIYFNAYDYIINHDAQSFRILINSGDGSGTTTLENIRIYNSNAFQETEIYDSNFEKMMCNVSNVSNTIPRTFEVGSGKNYSALLPAIIDAMKYNDSVVRVGAGTYDLTEEYKALYGNTYFDDYRYSKSGMGGLYLKNRVHIIFDANSKVTLNYTGTNTDVQTYFSAFNAGEYGFTIENINLETSNIRYSIHDERNGDSTPNINRYINCDIKHDSSNTTWGPHQCIGGGFGKSTFIEIRGCRFDVVGIDYAVSYHNVNNGGTDYQSKIEMHDCYFENGGFYIGNFGNSTKISEAYVSNCSFSNGAQVIRYYDADNGVDNAKLIAWNNEFRSPN